MAVVLKGPPYLGLHSQSLKHELNAILANETHVMTIHLFDHSFTHYRNLYLGLLPPTSTQNRGKHII